VTSSFAFILLLVALAVGTVAVVAPLVVTQLIFIPPAARLISKVRVSGRDWAATIAVFVGLAVFLVVADPSAGTPDASNSAWLLVVEGFLVVIAALDRHRTSAQRRG